MCWNTIYYVTNECQQSSVSLPLSCFCLGYLYLIIVLQMDWTNKQACESHSTCRSKVKGRFKVYHLKIQECKEAGFETDWLGKGRKWSQALSYVNQQNSLASVGFASRAKGISFFTCDERLGWGGGQEDMHTSVTSIYITYVMCQALAKPKVI